MYDYSKEILKTQQDIGKIETELRYSKRILNRLIDFDILKVANENMRKKLASRFEFDRVTSKGNVIKYRDRCEFSEDENKIDYDMENYKEEVLYLKEHIKILHIELEELQNRLERYKRSYYKAHSVPSLYPLSDVEIENYIIMNGYIKGIIL